MTSKMDQFSVNFWLNTDVFQKTNVRSFQTYSRIYPLYHNTKLMNLIRKGHRHTHRGIIGVESAIVLIAFVIVAAALSFVVLNMGFSTTQKAKTTIVSTLSEAGSTLEIEGKVIASSYQASAPSSINATSMPIKIAGGGESVNLDPSITAVKYLSNTISYDDIYKGTLNVTSYDSLEDATAAALTATYINRDPFNGGADADNNDWPDNTVAFTYWTVRANDNPILESGEHAVLAVVYSAGDRPAELDTVRTELIVASGAALTVERQIPNITSEVVDLG